MTYPKYIQKFGKKKAKIIINKIAKAVSAAKMGHSVTARARKKISVTLTKYETIKRKCVHCNRIFACKENSDRKFCSFKCSSFNKIGNNRVLRIKRKCLCCNKQFECRETSSKNFCCRYCYYKYRKDNYKCENHYNWQGGKSFEIYPQEFNKSLKEQIRQRDRYRCQECFRHQDELRTKTNKSYKLIVHHIDYNKKNNNSNNLLSLCRSCHLKTNFGRLGWTHYFRNANPL